MKKLIHIIGFDDAPFDRKYKYTYLIGTITKGACEVDGFIITKVEIDGNDSTKRIAESVINSRHYKQLRAILLNGITFAGFNVVDIEKLNEITKLPVIVVIRKYPNFEEIEAALKKIDQLWKLELMKKAGKPKEIKTKFGKVYVQYKGISFEEVRELINNLTLRSRTPEPIRISHMIGRALVYGESKGETS